MGKPREHREKLYSSKGYQRYKKKSAVNDTSLNESVAKAEVDTEAANSVHDPVYYSGERQDEAKDVAALPSPTSGKKQQEPKKRGKKQRQLQDQEVEKKIKTKKKKGSEEQSPESAKEASTNDKDDVQPDRKSFRAQKEAASKPGVKKTSNEEVPPSSPTVLGDSFDLKKLGVIVDFIRKALKEEVEDRTSSKTKVSIPPSSILILEGSRTKEKGGSAEDAPSRTASDQTVPTVTKPDHSTLKIYDPEHIASSPEYVYFAEAVANVRGKHALKFLKTNQKHLIARSTKNAAERLPQAAYSFETVGDTVTVSTRNLSNDKREAHHTLRKLAGIREIKSLPVDRTDLDYIVYKYEDDFAKITQASGLSLGESILGYYLTIPRLRKPSRALLTRIAENDWPEGDRILFEENSRRHGSKFWKYTMPRTTREIEMYAMYLSRIEVPKNWTSEERRNFAVAYPIYRKNWAKYSEVLPAKTADEVKKYYAEYFQRLTNEEKEEEATLSLS